MAYETKDNSGVAFKNDKKTKENQPEYKGSVRIGGVDYWQSIWIKDSPKGKYLSFAYEEKDAKYTKKTTSQVRDFDPGNDDGIPF